MNLAYNGYLKPFLPRIIKMHQRGYNINAIANTILKNPKLRSEDRSHPHIKAIVRYILADRPAEKMLILEQSWTPEKQAFETLASYNRIFRFRAGQDD